MSERLFCVGETVELIDSEENKDTFTEGRRHIGSGATTLASWAGESGPLFCRVKWTNFDFVSELFQRRFCSVVPSVDPRWLTSAVLDLAATGNLVFLRDALMDAGCDDNALLNHLAACEREDDENCYVCAAIREAAVR